MESTSCKLTLRALRINSGYTIESWGAKLNVSGATISRWERGLSKIPQGQIRRMCELGGVNESMLSMEKITVRKEKKR